MSKIPVVSVVIPLYNKGAYIARALNSVLTQTFQDFELIVVDDGSTDDGAMIVGRFDDPRIQLIQQENRGVGAARNRGIEAARAELVAFLDADDEWLPGFLEVITRMRDRFPSAGAYATAVSVVYEEGGIRHSFYRSVASPNWEGLIADYFRSYVLGDFIILSSSVAIPRKILLEMHGFVINERWGEDLDLWSRIALKYPIGFSTSYCVLRHVIKGKDKNYYLEHLYSRVSATKENPFLKSLNVAISAERCSLTDMRYLKLYLDEITIESAIYNAIIGEKKFSKKILERCTLKAFFLTKISIIFWCLIPNCTVHKNSIIREKSLLIMLYLLQLETRILALTVNYEAAIKWI